MSLSDLSFLAASRPAALSRWWLLLGCASLALAGLFSLVLVIARTPALSSMPLFVNLFHTSLVAHVDLSVLAWFLCIACLMWSLLASGRPSPMPLLEESALISMGTGILFLALSPLDTAAPAMMSNYIPVIHSPVFFFGLTLILSSALLMLARMLSIKPLRQPLSMGIYLSGGIALIAIAAFAASYRLMPPVIEGEQYYELLFWGGGHVLQYLNVQILMVAWLLLTVTLNPAFDIPKRWLWAILLITPAVALFTPMGYISGDVASMEHRLFFTHAMIGAGGLAPGLLAVIIIPSVWRARGKRRGENRAVWSSLAMSVLLFATGGLLGWMIEGQNVIIPAHYHGSIIGVTLAFMGAAYLWLPAFGYRNPASWRLAYWQPIVYGAGQLVHIGGLAWSGGYGVLRKTPGALETGFTSAKAAMGLMGLGGLMAAVGGLMFVIVVVRAIFFANPAAISPRNL